MIYGRPHHLEIINRLIAAVGVCQRSRYGLSVVMRIRQFHDKAIENRGNRPPRALEILLRPAGGKPLNLFIKGRPTGTGEQAGVQWAQDSTDAGHAVEIRIPYRGVSATPKAGTRWLFNLRRDEGRVSYVWSPTPAAPTLATAGFLCF